MKIIDVNALINQYIADLAIFIIKLHNLHWNVKGNHFIEIHEYTEKLYTRFFTTYDEFAEVLKAKNEIVFGSMSDYLRVGTLKEVAATEFRDFVALDIIKADLEMLLMTVISLRQLSQQTGDFTCAMLADKEIQYIEKQLWFVNATLNI
jgi:starvation-inducible DNA-binding protein